MKIEWPKFKDLVDSSNLLITMVELEDCYYLTAGGFSCRVLKVDNQDVDLIDFETNYLIKCNNPILRDDNGMEVHRNGAVAFRENYKLRMKGASTIVAFGTTDTLEYKILEDCITNGVQLTLKNHVFGDYANFKVIDIDNVLGYGANTVLDEFANKVWMNESSSGQTLYKCDYAARLYQGLYLVVEYTSTGSVNVNVNALFFLHKEA